MSIERLQEICRTLEQLGYIVTGILNSKDKALVVYQTKVSGD